MRDLTPQAEQIARGSLLLSSAPPEVVDRLLGQARMQSFPHGSAIFAQNDKADTIFVLIEGWVKLYRITRSGTEAVVGVFTKGHSFGEAVALRGMHYPVHAEAVTDTVLLRLDAELFLSLLLKEPQTAIAMLTATFAHLHDLVVQVEQLKARTGPQRVAEFLVGLTQGQIGACSVKLPYDKAVIAGRLGMQPESLSRAFSKLREHGVAVSRDSASIDDVELLRSYSEDDRANAWQHD